MHLGTAQAAIGSANHSHALHFPPVTASVCAVEIASGVHTASCGDGFNGGNLSNDLKVHDVSASSSSGLQIHDTYALVLPRVSMSVAERYVGLLKDWGNVSPREI
jgi:hypothetical protein